MRLSKKAKKPIDWRNCFIWPQKKYLILYSSIKCSYNKAEANFEIKYFRLKNSNIPFLKCQPDIFQLFFPHSPSTRTYREHLFSAERIWENWHDFRKYIGLLQFAYFSGKKKV